MRLQVRNVLKRDGWNNCDVRQIILATEEPSVAKHVPTGIPTEEIIGDAVCTLSLPDGSEVYETASGEKCVRIPDTNFPDGVCLTLSEAVALYGEE